MGKQSIFPCAFRVWESWGGEDGGNRNWEKWKLPCVFNERGKWGKWKLPCAFNVRGKEGNGENGGNEGI
jgi:hypothetical protein